MALLRAKLGVSLFRHPCRKPPSQWEGAECGAAALTPLGATPLRPHFYIIKRFIDKSEMPPFRRGHTLLIYLFQAFSESLKEN